MKHWRHWAINWLRRSGPVPLLVIALLFPSEISQGCGPVYRVFYGYTFINPQIVDLTNDFAPFFLDFQAIYEYYKGPNVIQIQDNVQEWWERFCKKPKPDDIAAIVYQSTIRDLEDLRSAITSEAVPLSYLGSQLSDNSFARYLHRNKCTEAIDYLIFAKRCEPHVTAKNEWEESGRDVNAMLKLIERGKRDFLLVKSHYFRLRYAYQLVRLAHYAKEYELTLELYDFLMPKIDHDPSLIEYWILGHRAGAMMALGQNVEASYLFSRIFENCPSKRESAYRSFRIRTDEEWQQCLLLCRNDRERAMLHVLRANAENSRLVEEMRSIYDYDPKNPNLELLLVREVKKLEKDLLGLEFNRQRQENKREFNIPRPIAGDRVIELQQFVRQVLRDGLIEDLQLWKIAEGYLELLAGNFYFAAQTFKAAEDMVTDKTLREQLQVFQMVLRINAIAEISSDIEEEVGEIQRSNPYYQQYPSFPNFIRDKFARLYRENDDAGKAFLTEYTLGDLKANPQLNIINDLLELVGREDLNRFERNVILKAESSSMQYDLVNLQANLFIAASQIEAALETFKAIPVDRRDDFGVFNPFVERINDCVNCALPDTLTPNNKAAILQQILELEYRAKAETDPDRAAILYYRTGNAYYNISYFGHAWQVGDAFRSGSSLARHRRGSGNNVVPHPRFPLGNLEHFDVSRARFFFDKARLLAVNPEIAARAAFMAAKCEQKDYYVNAAPGIIQTRENFDLLRDFYSQTNFYQRIIRECRYFRAYVSR